MVVSASPLAWQEGMILRGDVVNAASLFFYYFFEEEAAMREGAEKEFFNTQSTRYVRDHAMRAMVYSEGKPDDKALPYRLLAKSIIYQTLRDAYTEEEEMRKRLNGLLNSPAYDLWKVTKVIRANGAGHYFRYTFRHKGDLIYSIRHSPYVSFDNKTPASVEFFLGTDYRFYADLAGIHCSGESLLKAFFRRADKHLPSLDKILEKEN